jgi:hypothetical protein
MATIRLASETGSRYRSGRCPVPRAASAASASAGRPGPRSGPGWRRRRRRRSWRASGLIVVGVAGEVVADRLRHGLARDVLPGVLEGWHAEQRGEPGQVP